MKILSAQEKLERRRLQYRVHQRRHRMRQKEKTETLERDVQSLRLQMLQLQGQREMLHSRVFSAPTTTNGAPMHTAIEYCRFLQHGQAPEQMRFLAAAFDAYVCGPDYIGVSSLMEQWRLYSNMFRKIDIVIKNATIAKIGDMTKVELTINLGLCPYAHSILKVYPAIADNEALITQLVRDSIVVPGTVGFVFGADGSITWHDADLDFVGALQAKFRSLTRVAMLMQDSPVSMRTGHIVLGPERQQHTDSDVSTSVMSSHAERTR